MNVIRSADRNVAVRLSPDRGQDFARPVPANAVIPGLRPGTDGLPWLDRRPSRPLGPRRPAAPGPAGGARPWCRGGPGNGTGGHLLGGPDGWLGHRPG